MSLNSYEIAQGEEVATTGNMICMRNLEDSKFEGRIFIAYCISFFYAVSLPFYIMYPLDEQR